MTMDQWFALLRASMQYKDYRAVYPVPALKKMLDAVEPDLPTFMELAADLFRLVEGNNFTSTKINGHLDPKSPRALWLAYPDVTIPDPEEPLEENDTPTEPGAGDNQLEG
ncbi:hypothetical protein QNH07_gp65 [Aeromonas phage BUCT696]|uniref:hypothetical protein n=1 Tax=Aeromonas phage BUCT696 TaxID=2911664 RepID=UPI0024ADD616|nr:hypothetical protein QNH07_gp65 [Aeromonas phage BUCT696]UKH48830.1 hypothetical protein [Aeromonas phage BUCT696]